MKPLWLALAVAVAAWTVWRWGRLSTEQRLIRIVGVAATAVYGSGLVAFPDVEALIEDLGEGLGKWTYLLVGLMAFLETGAFVGLLAPGETVVVLGGVIAGQGRISVVVLIGLVWTAAVAGDVASYALGRRLGRGFLLRHGPKVKITRERLEQVERFYASHGGKAILFGRFIGLVRAISPFIAGASRLPFRRFLPYDVIGAGLWGTAFVLLGYFSWRSFDKAVEIAGKGALAVGSIIAVVVGVVVAARFLREPVNRERVGAWVEAQSQRRGIGPIARAALTLYRHVLVPFWRRISGPVRFAWGRVTPGDLGLELTSLLAIVLVGTFLFTGLSSLLDGERFLPADLRALGYVDDLRTPVAVDVAKVATWLGSLIVVGAITLVVAAAVAARRRFVEAVTLVAGLGLTVLAVNLAKDLQERPRPLSPLVATDGHSFPSGHAAYAVALIAVAVVLARVGTGLLGKVSLVGLAVGLAVVVGATRVYLRAHFVSDVLGGWALGAAIFGVCGMVALIVSFLRDNARAP